MGASAASLYAESQVTCAPPLKIVRLVSHGAISSLRAALARLEAGDRTGFLGAVSKAQGLVGELHGSLDLERGGSIAEELDRLYAWSERALIEAARRGERPGIEQVIRVLSTLHEGWEGIQDVPGHGR
jgi:flagellar secretion chaperone FliS